MTDESARGRALTVLLGLALAGSGIVAALAAIFLGRWYDIHSLSELAPGPGRLWLVIVLWLGAAAFSGWVARTIWDPAIAPGWSIRAFGSLAAAGLLATTLWRVRWLSPAWPLTGAGAVAVGAAAATVAGWALLAATLPGRSAQRESTWRLAGPAGRIAALVTVVAVGALTGAAGLVVQPGYGDRVAGPFGRYPAPPSIDTAAEPRLLAQFHGPVTLVDGLAVVGDGNRIPGAAASGAVEVHNGLGAVDLHTRRLYWSYQRPGHAVVATHASRGELFVLWSDRVLVRIDTRSGAIRWHRRVAAATVFADSRIETSSASVLLIGDEEIDALDASSGAPEWHVTPPSACAFDAGWPAIAGQVLAVTVAERHDDPGCSEQVRAYDLRTGHLRWQHQDADALAQPPLAVSQTLLATIGRAGVDIVDADSGRVQRSIAVDGQAVDAGGGRVFDDTGAWDAATGRRLWAHKAPHGERHASGPQLVNSQLACATTIGSGPKIDDGKQTTTVRPWLYCYDAATGQLRSYAAAPSFRCRCHPGPETTRSASPPRHTWPPPRPAWSRSPKRTPSTTAWPQAILPLMTRCRHWCWAGLTADRNDTQPVRSTVGRSHLVPCNTLLGMQPYSRMPAMSPADANAEDTLDTTNFPQETEVLADSKGRLALSGVGAKPGRRYLVRREADDED